MFVLKGLIAKVWRWIAKLPNTLFKITSDMIKTIPPYDLTVTRIAITETRIRDYWKTHGQLPTHLSDLPILDGRDNATNDGWGRAIKYEVRGLSTVTLTSFGAQGLAGNENLNQEIITTFDADKEL